MNEKSYIENKALFADWSKTAAGPLLEQTTYPWEILPLISAFILRLGETLPEEEYEKRSDNIWIARDAKVFDSAYIGGPCIIGHGTEVRHCAFIRENALIGAGCVVGNSTELKNVILFDGVEVPHYNYVGDSILGYKAHMGAGSITSNIKADRKDIVIRMNIPGQMQECEDIQEAKAAECRFFENADKEIRMQDEAKEAAESQETVYIETGMQKIGAILGDYVEIGCGTVLNPGSIIGQQTNIYPLNSVRGVIPAKSICKSADCIIPKIV